MLGNLIEFIIVEELIKTVVDAMVTAVVWLSIILGIIIYD